MNPLRWFADLVLGPDVAISMKEYIEGFIPPPEECEESMAGNPLARTCLANRRKFFVRFRDMFPHTGFCLRCGSPWRIIPSHGTLYSEREGLSCLCTLCWSEIRPEERLPYYESFMEIWEYTGTPASEDKKVLLRAAVLEGK